MLSLMSALQFRSVEFSKGRSVSLCVCVCVCLPACMPGWLAGWLSVGPSWRSCTQTSNARLRGLSLKLRVLYASTNAQLTGMATRTLGRVEPSRKFVAFRVLVLNLNATTDSCEAAFRSYYKSRGNPRFLMIWMNSQKPPVATSIRCPAGTEC